MSATTAPSPADDAPRTAARTPADVVARAGLPAELGELVLAVTGKLRLWPRERIDVARELCAHFADGLAEGRTASELASDFGQPKDAARLITRAKKRTRPWWYRSWVRFGNFCGVLLVIFVVFYTFAAIRYYVGKPSIRVDYLAQLNAPVLAVAPEDRAWPRYLDAYMRLPVIPVIDDKEILSADLQPGTPEWTAAEKYVRDNASILADIRAASTLKTSGYVLTHNAGLDFSKRPGWRPRPGTPPVAAPGSASSTPQTGLDGSLIAMTLPNMQVYRETARVLAFDTRLAARDGDAARAMGNIRAMLALSRHSVEPTTLLIGQLVGSAIFARAAMSAEQLMIDAPSLLTSEQITELSSMFARWRANPLTGDDTVDTSGERTMMLDTLQRIYTDDGNGDGRLANANTARLVASLQTGDASPRGDNVFVGAIASQVIAGRAATLKAYDDALAEMAQRSALPLRQREVEAMRSDRFESYASRLHYLFAATMVPALDVAAKNLTLAAARREAVQVGLALERYRLAHGTYPATLRELVPTYITTVPPDPWDGGAIKYAAPKSSTDRPRLYSVGRDLKDDGGDETEVRPADAKPATADTPPARPEPRDILFWGGKM